MRENVGVAIVSGGLDSVTLAHMLAEKTEQLTLVSFDYGQKHLKELEFARECAAELGAEHIIADLSGLGNVLDSALTSEETEVPDGHYAEDSMKITVVPNRNMIMLSIAAGIAVSKKANYVATGVHAGDHFVYPDCRPPFIVAVQKAIKIGNEGFIDADFVVDAPFVTLGKHDIVTVGMNLGVDFTKTWSCYKGGNLHCGTCGTCVERKEAFELAGYQDPTEYLDV